MQESPREANNSNVYPHGTKRRHRNLNVHKGSNMATNENTVYVAKKNRSEYKVIAPATADENTTLDPNFTQLLLRHTWHTYRLSPLNNLQYSQTKLKQYAARIKQALASKIYDNATNIFSATVTVISQTSDNNNDAKSLQIEVMQKKNNSEPQPKYRGMLLSWDDDFESEYVTRLPLLLCTGTATVMRIVHSTLQDIFDTVVRPFSISQENIMWMMLINNFNSEHSKKKIAKQIQFSYTVPYQSPRNLVKVALPVRSVHILWTKLHSKDSEGILLNEKENFYDILNDHLYNCFNINFNHLQLCKISVPHITVHTTGRIKFHEEEGACEILEFLQNISIILKDACPEMGFRCI